MVKLRRMTTRLSAGTEAGAIRRSERTAKIARAFWNEFLPFIHDLIVLSRGQTLFGWDTAFKSIILWGALPCRSLPAFWPSTGLGRNRPTAMRHEDGVGRGKTAALPEIAATRSIGTKLQAHTPSHGDVANVAVNRGKRNGHLARDNQLVATGPPTPWIVTSSHNFFESLRPSI